MSRQFQKSAKAESKPANASTQSRLLQSSWGAQEPSPQSEPAAPPPVLHEAVNIPIHPTDRPIIQPKLTIGPVGDKYEQEADQIAAQVVNQINAPQSSRIRGTIQRHETKEEEDKLQRKPLLQNLSGGIPATPKLEAEIGRSRSGGQPLAENIRTPMERAFGANFSGVRVHTDAQANQLNRSIQAKAFTTKQDIFFRQGAYRPESRSGQELLAHELTHIMQQNSGVVQRSPANSHGSGCACAYCMGGNLHIQRHPDKVHSLGCSCPLCSGKGELIQAKFIETRMTPEAVSIQRQREGTVQTKVTSPQIIPNVQQSITQDTIQRHASWEHRLLGDVTPDALEIMGASRTKATQMTGMRLETSEHGSEFVKVTRGPYTGKVIDQELVLHTLEQEIRRLEYFRDHPPQDASTASAQELSDLDARDRREQARSKGGAFAVSEEMTQDKTWQVRLVKVPLKNHRYEIVTYGELNTLADFYGSTKELYATDPDNFHKIIQGIRQRTMYKLMEIYEEVSGDDKYQKKAKEAREKQAKARTTGAKVLGGVKTVGKVGLGLTGVGAIGLGVDYKLSDASSKYAGLGFEGAIGNTGAVRGELGEARLRGAIPGHEGKKALEGRPETSYGAGLGRNACHFAPESWHNWAAYHKKARALAREAWGMTVEANDMTNDLSESLRRTRRLQADALGGQALIENGFGDHFLQDSYAAGHLINKTQIMQWYVQWLDTQPWDEGLSKQ
ncbi:DUF4157 domain-containing protein [Kovacikia minuta CCNUW1]|uniref:eCIS core domain-containing protein n=1 Tax=Kovacikia minuta TaxID=2931930 RepID=UPI001CCC1E72|nr:DUF4157 domain-containing protein [Kovacikia minuta]UBF24835.1 DUF4157 domain-containing protein [Kovacikia minuta CCNUW1]